MQANASPSPLRGRSSHLTQVKCLKGLPNYGVISVSKTDIPDASVRNFMQAFVTSCKRFKNFMQAVQNFMQAVPKLYASGPKLYASVRNFMQAV